MATLYVARSATLSDWGLDVGLSKHLYKIGLTDEPVKALVATGWAGLSDWSLVRKQDDVPLTSESDMLEQLGAKLKVIDPALYPKIKGMPGLFKITPTQVENHILVAKALAGTADSATLKLKPTDFAAYLMHHALRTGDDSTSRTA